MHRSPISKRGRLNPSPLCAKCPPSYRQGDRDYPKYLNPLLGGARAKPAKASNARLIRRLLKGGGRSGGGLGAAGLIIRHRQRGRKEQEGPPLTPSSCQMLNLASPWLGSGRRCVGSSRVYSSRGRSLRGEGEAREWFRPLS